MWLHPLRLEHAPGLQIKLAPLNNDISEILRAYGLPDSVQFLPYHATKALYPGGNRAINLLYVFLHGTDEMPSRLGPIKDAIIELLIENQMYDIHVEITNEDLTFNSSLFPLAPETSIIVAFEK